MAEWVDHRHLEAIGKAKGLEKGKRCRDFLRLCSSCNWILEDFLEAGEHVEVLCPLKQTRGR